MAGSSSKKARIQKQALAGLGLLMVGVVVYQFFFNAPEPRSRRTASNSNAPARTATTTRPTTTQQPAQPNPAPRPSDPDAALQAELADITPLVSVVAVNTGSSTVGPRGNVFAYYVPPPPLPPKPEPPPPITLNFVQPQSVVAGTPRKFTLTITGQAIPADAQILLDGRPKPTKRVSDTILSTEIEPGEYTQSRNMRIEVKSQSDPVKFYSNPVSFVVQAAPEPPFKYVGRLGDQGLFEITASKLLQRAKVSETIQNVWRIDSITDAQVEVTHTQYDIKKRLALQPKDR